MGKSEDAWLPQDTILGPLTMVESYDFYDQPVLFLCKGAGDQLYFVVLVHAVGSENEWLYVPVSKRRYKSIKNHELTLREAFNQPGSYLLHVRPFRPTFVQKLDQIPPEYLPRDNELL